MTKSKNMKEGMGAILGGLLFLYGSTTLQGNPYQGAVGLFGVILCAVGMLEVYLAIR